jgi:hypothetical protein
MSAPKPTSGIFMTAQKQADLVGEIAGLVRRYRQGDAALVKFGMKCGLALNKQPIAGGVMHSRKTSNEQFKISDPAFREGYASEQQAFFAALDTFFANRQFLAWDGKVPDAKFDVLKELSDNYAWPTMMIEMVHRDKGAEEEKRLNMFFIGFPDDAAAEAYAKKPKGLVTTRPLRGTFFDWY